MATGDEILAFRDQVVTILDAKWKAAQGLCYEAGAVEGIYLPVNRDEATGQEVAVVEVEKIKGRKVYVYPKAFGQRDIATRKADLMAYTVGVQVYEVFDRQTAGMPAKDWCDARVRFVTLVHRWLSNPRKGGTTFTGALAGAYPDEGTVDLVFDPDRLRKDRVFWSVLSFTYCLEVDPS